MKTDFQLNANAVLPPAIQNRRIEISAGSAEDRTPDMSKPINI
jgi:hypothetical protein